MKIRVTHEIGDEARTALNLALTGSFTPASREVCEAWLINTMRIEVDEMAEAFAEVKAEFLKRLKT